MHKTQGCKGQGGADYINSFHEKGSQGADFLSTFVEHKMISIVNFFLFGFPCFKKAGRHSGMADGRPKLDFLQTV